MKKIVPVVIALIHKDNKFLLTKRVVTDSEDMDFYPFVWNLPGGGVDFGEEPIDALKREIKEELGVEIINIQYIPKIFTNIRKNWQGLFLSFICELKNTQDKIILNDEANEYGWFTLDSAIKLKTFPKTIEMIKEADKIITK